MCFLPPANPAPAPRGGFALCRRSGRAGFTVMEASIAGAILMAFLTSLFALNSNMMRMLSSASEAANASQSLQQRVEQVRLSNWQQISDPNWVGKNLLGTMTDAAVNLSGMTESITVSAYRAPSSLTYAADPGSFTVTRTGTGAITVSPAGFASTALLSQEMLQVNVAVRWPGWSRPRSRELTTLVSRWGISK